jgi:phage shock protein A
MSENATKSDLKQLDNKLDSATERLEKSIDQKIVKAVSDLSDVIANFAQQVDNRFNRVEERLDKLEVSHEKLISTIDGFVTRNDTYET